MIRNIGTVVPVFNNLFYTKQLLQSIKRVAVTSKLVSKFKIVVVDNGSTDGTRDFLQEEKYSITNSSENATNIEFEYILNETNQGYGGGCNRGIELLQKDEIEYDYLIANNDMIFLDNVFDELIKAAYSKDNIGIVGGKLLFPDNTIQHAGAFLNVFGWGQHIGGGVPEDQLPSSNAIEEMEYCTGALLYIKQQAAKLLIEKEGHIFDERFFMYFEEVDLAYVLREYGYKTVYAPLSRAIHFEGLS
jgi:GT2 family glycosyltransferase